MMADQMDMAAEISALHLDISMRAARQPVPVGVEGECEQCEEHSPRLVAGRCAFCRDGRQRP